ncbi:hypothetical protein M413DRAFT_439132 [Hebeloma cylindrosporum]|uniref:Lethal giant larvae (Lgl)-like C-terminal domain-containing protein n=1 Tax=Hebeloma cylindrosporum TaxID=76867 RepID=A0A0C3CUA1_HEBCY|nr:hypothetical protein M413DRAFT_439132 [Hebeloma cylindrosporum h7]
MTLSPSHSHVFLATRNGDIKTYDLTCLRKSPYNMPNLWKLYENKMAADGIPSLTSEPAPLNAVDVVIHPRNLDLLFVAYAGGVILTNLTERSTIRAYELILPPGAPGGAGYGLGDILTHRRMVVTSLAVHPSGHFFAVGYADGSIAFWAVEDDNSPLLVRTLEDVDVNLVNADKLEEYMGASTNSNTPRTIREPIFKLSWSSFANAPDPRGGDTALAILGGLDASMPPGLTTFLLPAFNPTEPPSEPPAPPDSLHPFFRNAMRQSLTISKPYFYETRGIVQDYLLLPHTSPHLGGNFDPYGILLITEYQHTRTVEAYQYPPPGFVQIPQAPPKVEEAEDEGTEAAGGLMSPMPPTPLPKSPRHTNPTPQPLRTPFTLSAGNSGALDGRLFRVNNDIYQDLVSKNTYDDLHLRLKGGQAFADTTKANELKLLKYQPRRILMTYNGDLSVQFFDISTQLNIPVEDRPLEHDWPEALPWLDIRLDEVFDDPAIADILSVPTDRVSIQSAQVALEALECALILSSGEVFIYHHAMNRSTPASSKILADTEIVLLDHIHVAPGRTFAPYFILAANKGPVETCALSDIGFLAVSYKDGSFIVVDMRGPKIILSREAEKKQRHSMASAKHLHAGHPPTSPHSHHGSGPEIVKALTWTVTSLDKDPQLAVRLIAAHQSGQAEIFSLEHSGSPVSWSVSSESVPCKAVSDPTPESIYILDRKTGAPWKADRAGLSASLKGLSAEGQCFLITVGAKGARSTLNINGEKIGKVEWGHKVGTVLGSQIVEHMASRVLVVQTDKHDALIYSLPHLEHIHTAQLPPISTLPLAIDESGDFIAWTRHPRSGGVIQAATYSTFFDIRRSFGPPDFNFISTHGSVPPQPQPVSLGPASLLGSWFSFNETLSGDQVDELLGGPNRPIPEKPQLTRGSSEEGLASTAAGAAAGFAASASAMQANLYNRLTSAVSERGQLLGDLSERFNTLEEDSKNMLAQAKRLAAQQTAKGWFGF